MKPSTYDDLPKKMKPLKNNILKKRIVNEKSEVNKLITCLPKKVKNKKRCRRNGKKIT